MGRVDYVTLLPGFSDHSNMLVSDVRVLVCVIDTNSGSTGGANTGTTEESITIESVHHLHLEHNNTQSRSTPSSNATYVMKIVSSGINEAHGVQVMQIGSSLWEYTLGSPLTMSKAQHAGVTQNNGYETWTITLNTPLDTAEARDVLVTQSSNSAVLLSIRHLTQ